jgi:hypothetical protein
MTKFGMPGGQLGEPRSRCLGAELTAYADRAMDAASLRHWDRHLVACTSCRQAVEAERRMLSSLRAPAGADLPRDLRSMLLAVACEPVGVQPSPRSRRTSVAVPPVPVAPVRAVPVPVLDRSAPALHRSVVRATVCAGLAAGATAAAAWSLAITGSNTPAGSSNLPVQPARPATPAMVNAATRAPVFTSTSVASVLGWNAQPAVRTVGGRSAQSTP